ncbi:MAG: hypothetical protein DRP23_03130 [Thermotogae bacterium]|nr:MAG: hypothetical protein DRP23_03130 [Thermotogota bacterium]
MKITAIGGGTGLSMLLRGLKEFPVEITAVVSVTDEGGSSGTIRKELRIPPPGDVRNNIVALAKDEHLLGKLMNYRFENGSFKGHTVGNLMIAALTKMTGSFSGAIKILSEILAIKGKVLPVSEDLVRLVAFFEDGSKVVGETRIVEKKGKIVKVELDRETKALPEVLETLRKSDMIILGPGSLYTSVVTNLLVKGVKEAIQDGDAILAYVCNIMTQPGETVGYRLSDHVKEIERYLGKEVDFIIANSQRPSDDILERYRKEGADLVVLDLENLDKMVVVEPLLCTIKDPYDGRVKVRHDPMKLAKTLMKMMGWREKS